MDLSNYARKRYYYCIPGQNNQKKTTLVNPRPPTPSPLLLIRASLRTPRHSAVRARASIYRQTFLHKSRHDHAMRRVRGPGGRFLTKAELNLYRKQLEAQDPEGATAPAPAPGTGKKNQVLVLYEAVLHCAALCSTVLHCTVMYCVVLYCTAPYRYSYCCTVNVLCFNVLYCCTSVL